HSRAAWPRVEHRRQDIAAVMWTSGSGGTPKGVVLTNGNILANLLAINEYMALTATDCCLVTRSLSHASALFAEAWLARATGGRYWSVVGVNSLSALGRACEDVGVTWAGMTPTLLRLITASRARGGRAIDIPRVVVS